MSAQPNDEGHKAYFRAYYLQHKEHIIATCRNSRLVRKYGITTDQLNEMLVKQHHKCALCGEPFVGQRYVFFVDHDHRTGEVRGILHSKCNGMLGVVENPEFMKKATAYLESFR